MSKGSNQQLIKSRKDARHKRNRGRRQVRKIELRRFMEGKLKDAQKNLERMRYGTDSEGLLHSQIELASRKRDPLMMRDKSE